MLCILQRTCGLIGTLAGVLFFAGLCPAQSKSLEKTDKAAPESPKGTVVKLLLHPAAAPVPAMKYQLLPEVQDLKPGNAALLYQRAQALEWWGEFLRSGRGEKIGDLLDMPIAKMPREQGNLLLGPLGEMDMAARREYCDWELTPRIRADGYMLLIPDMQSFRIFGRMLALRARLNMLDGHFDEAVTGMQTGFALSRHVSDAPLLICSLVGNAIGSTMLNQVDEFVQFEKAPNLYWALADLPRPFIDLRRAMQGERLSIDSLFPEIRAALKDPSLPPISTQSLSRHLEQFRHISANPSREDWRMVVTMVAARTYPAAKKYLLDKGFTAEQVSAMPVTQAAIMYAVALYDECFDDLYRWQGFPYWQAASGMTKADQKFRHMREDQPEAMIIASSLLPAINRVVFAKVRTERRIAMLQVVEALRLHLSAEGKLPEQLDDVVAVPIPIDPVTGKSFVYTRTANGATLHAPPPVGEAPGEQNNVRYEISLAAAPKK